MLHALFQIKIVVLKNIGLHRILWLLILNNIVIGNVGFIIHIKGASYQ